MATRWVIEYWRTVKGIDYRKRSVFITRATNEVDALKRWRKQQPSGIIQIHSITRR
jgi:hypothetical protein